MAAGYIQRPDYAVLGDDVVICEGWDFFGKTKTQPINYLDIMTDLGVEISLQKSIISSKYIEFAKRVIDIEGQD